MSIYENGVKSKASPRTKMPSQKADTKQILNDKNLSKLVKQIKNGPKSAKEIIYDADKNILGVLQQNNEPFMFDKKQLDTFNDIVGL